MSIAQLSGYVTLDNQPLIDELQLDIDAGWTCLLGPSGSGKTTLLRLLAGLPCQAHLTGLREVPERIGWMAQSDNLQPRLNVLDNVRLMHCLRGTRQSEKEAEPLLHQVGLGDKLLSMPDELSGGQRQRVALARVLADGAPLVLLDEPFSALDPITRVAMQDLTYQCLQACAVLMVTHDPSEALRLADRIHVVSNRKLLEEHALAGTKPRPVHDPSLNIASGEMLNRLAGIA